MFEKPAYLIGIDGGGTKTDVVCTNLQGEILSTAQSGPTSLTAGSLGAAGINLREALRICLERLPLAPIQQLVMGVAGMDTPEEAKLAEQVFVRSIDTWQVQNFSLFNDTIVALANGTQQPDAVVIISGTGSNCFGINAQKKQAKTGGLDFLLTDEGSGYDIGRLVLHCAVKSADGRGQKTLLEQKVLDYFHVKNIFELKSQVYNPALSKTEISNVATLCHEAAEESDAVAYQILDYTAHQLYLMIKTVIFKLDLQAKPFDLVYSGGIIRQKATANLVTQKIKGDAPQANIISMDRDPVFGGIELAKQLESGINLDFLKFHLN